jgi:hypothetical protein
MLSMTDKGKYKWSGSFEELKKLLNQELGYETNWSSPGGDAKKFQNEKLTIRWYADSSSLIIKGDDSSVLKEKLASLMIKESEAVETISDLTTLIAEGNKHGVEDEVEGKIEHEDTHYNLHTN